ncbi:DNA-3-methyladenine glycosylase [Mechercharimyces sp. CAU 1602]|uniref:DNA-3-methyladenine glycosylase family protein n=1 Tax=Mechercharimyces sp. CAU 1602 TaxID=2973933 RepID=UPI002161AD7D|nr:hypothetical protein [Mechercharimyces sp. CAU 1602]MCS1352715.1 hypothetical protein [Mechercharimyces sp. CAU 1602]
MKKNPFAKIDIDEVSLTRSIVIDEQALIVTIRSIGDIESPKLVVEVLSDVLLSNSSQEKLRELIGFMFDADADIESFNEMASKHNLVTLMQALTGLRIVKDPTVFESIIKTIAGQQVSVTMAGKLIQKMCENYGEKVMHNGVSYYLPPSSDMISKLHEQDLRELGFPLVRARTLIECAKLDLAGYFNNLENLSEIELEKTLCAIKGIGPWTAQMIMLLGLGKNQIVPWADKGLHRAIEVYFSLTKGSVTTQADVERYFQMLQGPRSYITYFLWENMMNYRVTQDSDL